MGRIPEEIDTPDVVIDRDVLGRNIERMATAVKSNGLKLRPHVKSHNCDMDGGQRTAPPRAKASSCPQSRVHRDEPDRYRGRGA